MRLKTKLRQALSIVLTAATMLSLIVIPATAAEPGQSLGNGSSYVTIEKGTNYHFLYKSTGGTIGGSAWTYVSNDGITGPAYCVNWGLDMVSPSKRLQITGRYDRSPQTMGAFANGYPQQSLTLFKELHPDVRGIENLTEAEYAYATQVAVWATCGQLAVEDTAFTAGRATLVKPTSDAQQIRIYESVVAILKWANGWTKPLYTGIYFHMEKDRLGSSLEIIDPDGLEGAAAQGTQGLKRETINGTDYSIFQLLSQSACLSVNAVLGRFINICAHSMFKFLTFIERLKNCFFRSLLRRWGREDINQVLGVRVNLAGPYMCHIMRPIHRPPVFHADLHDHAITESEYGNRKLECEVTYDPDGSLSQIQRFIHTKTPIACV